ncbi:phage shock protein A [Catalinimonas alkaloidigena]|uniref:PspA/IM30 family protein n=1 Tax=Catalinimonas alkaloidigena TaxID=1075417 RepID=UPI002405731C|nr:PspA/IM30 family protein [Catalinimonas alkaloidigena]MDF9795654.1 phage shock protein A [Catalinimonas alkaloidigena]
MNIFRRILKVGEAETHSAIDRLEDPIKLTEQGIRDMRVDLDKALHALAEVKALSIRTQRELTQQQEVNSQYEKKAILLLQKAQRGELNQQEADRLASEALNKKEQAEQQVRNLTTEKKKYDESVLKLEHNINSLKSNISQWENELRTLKARMKVSTATKTMNKQLAKIDTSGTVSMLERMKNKVEQEEALAQSYGEIAAEPKTIDDEIDKAIGDDQAGSSQKLQELKQKLGINPNTP